MCITFFCIFVGLSLLLSTTIALLGGRARVLIRAIVEGIELAATFYQNACI